MKKKKREKNKQPNNNNKNTSTLQPCNLKMLIGHMPNSSGRTQRFSDSWAASDIPNQGLIVDPTEVVPRFTLS